MVGVSGGADEEEDEEDEFEWEDVAEVFFPGGGCCILKMGA